MELRQTSLPFKLLHCGKVSQGQKQTHIHALSACAFGFPSALVVSCKRSQEFLFVDELVEVSSTPQAMIPQDLTLPALAHILHKRVNLWHNRFVLVVLRSSMLPSIASSLWQAASDNRSKAAWKLVAAEAMLESGKDPRPMCRPLGHCRGQRRQWDGRCQDYNM